MNEDGCTVHGKKRDAEFLADDFDVGAAIRHARKSLGLNSEQVAPGAGIGIEEYKDAEAGLRTVTVPELDRIAAVLEIPVETVLTPDPQARKVAAIRRSKHQAHGVIRGMEELLDSVRTAVTCLGDDECLSDTVRRMVPEGAFGETVARAIIEELHLE